MHTNFFSFHTIFSIAHHIFHCTPNFSLHTKFFACEINNMVWNEKFGVQWKILAKTSFCGEWNFSVVFESQIPNSTLRRRMFMINTTTSFHQLKNMWNLGQILTDFDKSVNFEWWFRVESGVKWKIWRLASLFIRTLDERKWHCCVVVSLSPGENGRKHYTVFHKCALFCPVRLQYKSLLWLLHIQGIFLTLSLTFFMASLLVQVKWGGEPLDRDGKTCRRVCAIFSPWLC